MPVDGDSRKVRLILWQRSDFDAKEHCVEKEDVLEASGDAFLRALTEAVFETFFIRLQASDREGTVRLVEDRHVRQCGLGGRREDLVLADCDL